MIRVCRRPALFLAIIILFAAFVPAVGEDSPTDLIAQADLAYMTRHLEEDMTEAISLFEAVLPSLETLSATSQAYVLNRLSQLCYEVALFTEGLPKEDGDWYRKGKAYGYQSLRLNADFVAHEGDGIEQALTYSTDIAAMHWLANNWGMLCNINVIEGLIQQSNVLALFRRCVELDPGFWGASAASALGSLLIMLPGPLGGNDEEGLALVEQSIEDAPAYLNNRIILAEYWGFTYNYFGARTDVRDAEMIEREAAFILEGEIGDWPFWNRQAKLSAERLLSWLGEYTE